MESKMKKKHLTSIAIWNPWFNFSSFSGSHFILSAQHVPLYPPQMGSPFGFCYCLWDGDAQTVQVKHYWHTIIDALWQIISTIQNGHFSYQACSMLESFLFQENAWHMSQHYIIILRLVTYSFVQKIQMVLGSKRTDQLCNVTLDSSMFLTWFAWANQKGTHWMQGCQIQGC